MANKTTGPTVYTALIMPLSSHASFPKPQPPGGGGGGSGGQPDNTLPGDLPRPEHPIYFPLPPGAPVDPEYGIPEDGPYPDQGLPGSQPRPDQGLPGAQPKPEHPIVLPPDEGGWLPVYIDNTLPGDQPHPSHPIVLPPEGENPEGPIDWRAAWTPLTGWIVVGIPQNPHPTPSKGKAKRK